MGITEKIIQRAQAEVSKFAVRRENSWPGLESYISFTFDDFPRSAFLNASEILDKYKIRATYYVSMGFIGKQNRFWEYFTEEDLVNIITQEHEIGSHTFDHVDAWYGSSYFFEESIRKNQNAIQKLYPNYKFKTLSYCIRSPHPMNKKVAEKYFLCCRGGGNKINKYRIDLNLLSSFFIDIYHRDDHCYYFNLIDQNVIKNGWLIFSTHDVTQTPSPYGCTPKSFEMIVKYAKESGARIMPVIEVFQRVFGSQP